MRAGAILDVILHNIAELAPADRDVVLHAIRRAHPTHCFTRGCLRGSSAVDLETAVRHLQTFNPKGCECGCGACFAAGTNYSAAEST